MLRPSLAVFVVALLTAADPPTPDKPDIAISFDDSQRFGIALADESAKRLVYDAHGSTNNVCFRVDKRDFFLQGRGKTAAYKSPVGGPLPYRDGEVRGWRCAWEFADRKLTLTQDVSIQRGENSDRFDTCVVRYGIENGSKTKQTVGLRFVLDTLIGTNDGVPFTLPGVPGLCDTFAVFTKGKDVPEYVQALETADLRNPGLVAQIGIAQSGRTGAAESADGLQLSHWPGAAPPWSYAALPIGKDSAVALSWSEKPLAPGQRRDVGFTYGLGKVAVPNGKDKLAISSGGAFSVGGQFAVTAYAGRECDKQMLKIKLPTGLKLASGEKAQQKIELRPRDQFTQVSWRLVAGKAGTFAIEFEFADGSTQTAEVVIR